MTASSALLDPVRSGVYRTPINVAALRADAGATATWWEIDLHSVRNKRELLSALAAACAYTQSFGHNWDALADVLQDMSWAGTAAYVLHLQHAERAFESLGSDRGILLEVLTDSASYWRARARAFVVFVDGAVELAPWT
jgi:hypothetical protein